MRYIADGWLVSYDITNDVRRQDVARRLERVGVRQLYSAFWLPPFGETAIDRLLTQIDSDLRSGDRLIAVRSCRQCLTLGQGRPLESLPIAGVVV